MKAAAPQAPHTTHAAAKSGRTPAGAGTAPARSPSTSAAAAFDRIFARALSAKPGAHPRAAVKAEADAAPIAPGRAALPTPSDRAADAARTRLSPRGAGRVPARGREDEAPAARSPAEASRTLAASAAAVTAPAAAATLPAAAAEKPRAARAAPAKADPSIQVVDLRRRAAAVPEATDAARNTPKTASDKAADGTAAAKPFSDRLAAAEPRTTAPAAAAGQTPLERLREMTGSDLVKTAGLIVRDGGGEIRLTLKPESLGSVRIRLSLEDGRVEGRIVVDTPEARRAFEAGIEGLARALRADGFETGALQVSVSGGNAGDGRQAAGLLGDAIAGARLRALDGTVPEAAVVSGWTGDGDGLVNVYA